MEVDFVSAQGRDARGLLFERGEEVGEHAGEETGAAAETAGEAAGEHAGEEAGAAEKPLPQSIILEGVEDCAERKPPSEADSPPRKVPICEKQQLGGGPNGADMRVVKIKVGESEKTEEGATCREESLHRGKNELPQLDEPHVERGNTLAGRHTNRSRHVTPNRHVTPSRQGERERINQLYRNSKSTNIKLYKRMYQSYLLLRKEQNELLAQNRRKEERNKKLKYEMNSLRGGSYYTNFFFKNDADNLLEDLASGISNIWKWMDMEGRRLPGKNAPGGEPHGEAACERDGEPARERDGEAACQRDDEAAFQCDGEPLGEYARAQNEVPTGGSAAGGPSCGRGAAPSEDCPDDHPGGCEPKSDSPPGGAQPSGAQPSGAQPSGEQPDGEQPDGEQPDGEQPSGEDSSGVLPNGGRCPMANEHRTYTTSDVPMESSPHINEKETTPTMEGIPPLGRITQQATTHSGGPPKKVHFVKGGYKHPHRDDRNGVNLPPSYKSSSQDEKIEKKNSFLWEKESRPVKRGGVKYGQLHNRFAAQERSSTRVEKEPSSLASVECPKDNIIDYIKGRLSSGGRIPGKAVLPSDQSPPMGAHPSRIRPNDDPNKTAIKEGENLLFHICHCRENKYVPLNVGSFFVAPPKRTRPDEDFSLGPLRKCMGFIFRSEMHSSQGEMHIIQSEMHNGCSNAPPGGVPLANVTPNKCAPNEQKGAPPIGPSKGEETKKTRLVAKEVELKKGNKTERLEEGGERQSLKRGRSGRKRLLRVDRSGRPTGGGSSQNCHLKGGKYDAQEMDVGLGSKFGLVMRRKGSRRRGDSCGRRDPWGRLSFKVVPKKEEGEGEEISPPVVKVKTARLAPHAKGLPHHVRFVRIGRGCYHPRRSQHARRCLAEDPKGEKTQNGEKGQPIELPPNVCGNSGADEKADEGADAVTIGKGDNVVGGDTPEGNAATPLCSAITPEQQNTPLIHPNDGAPHGCPQRENGSSANLSSLKEALAKHVQSLDLPSRRIDSFEAESQDAVTIIGIQIKLREGHICFHLDGLSSIEESVRVWVKKNEQVLSSYVGGSESTAPTGSTASIAPIASIASTLKHYRVDVLTFMCVFLDALENCVEEFPFYLSLSLEEIFCVRGCAARGPGGEAPQKELHQREFHRKASAKGRGTKVTTRREDAKVV
ncbi:conserved Plasmodium protein, unknown function [Plasmodium vivax]|nr:conserved Plasmodium protein, unknown function [Plasmodium vivax]